MKNILLITTTLCLWGIFLPAQTRFANSEHQDFYNWFHLRSQVTELYRNHATLYVFGDAVKVYSQPKLKSTPLTTLEAGHTLINLAYPPEGRIPEGELRGYQDIWYHVKGIAPNGQAFNGYVFGIYIAKGWRKADINGDGEMETLLLGASSKLRKEPSDLNAEIRILSKGKQIHQATIPGMCLFEACDASAMLRVIKNQPMKGHFMIEASVMSIGCLAGIDRAFFYWNGERLERVYHAEFTTQHVWINQVFAAKSKDSGAVWNCSFQGIDANNEPIWNCQAQQAVAGQAAVRAK